MKENRSDDRRERSALDGDSPGSRQDSRAYFAALKGKLSVPTRLGPDIPVVPRTIGPGYGDMCFDPAPETAPGAGPTADVSERDRQRSRDFFNKLGVDLSR